MPKPIIDQTAAARIRADIQTASTGNVMDRIIALEHALEAILRVLEDAK